MSADHWDALVTAALLGTDRREPPDPPAGPIADLLLEMPTADGAASLVQQVATTTVLQRAAAVPSPPVAPLIPCAPDERPLCPPAAVDVLRRILSEWPLLETEWLQVAQQGGWRLPPDLVPELLMRHRAHPEMRARVAVLSGPVADWLAGLVPALGPAPRRAVSPSDPVALPPELADVADADARRIVDVVADGLRRQRYTSPSRAVLVHLVARVRPTELATIAHRLEALDPSMSGIGLAYHLADMATTRAAIHTLLAAVTPAVTPDMTPLITETR